MARMPMIPDPRYEANDRHATRLTLQPAIILPDRCGENPIHQRVK